MLLLYLLLRLVKPLRLLMVADSISQKDMQRKIHGHFVMTMLLGETDIGLDSLSASGCNGCHMDAIVGVTGESQWKSLAHSQRSARVPLMVKM